MKKNLGLLFILIALIASAYFSEELGEENRIAQLQIKERLYDPVKFGELQGLKTPAGKILRGRDDYYTSKEYKLADRSLVEFVFQILGGIKAKRFLTPDEIAGKERSVFIPNEKLKFTILFEKGTLTYVLGKKLDFDRSFYMEIHNSLTGKKTMAIAYDVTPDEAPKSESEFHRSSEKYDRLLTLLSLPEDYFYDRRIFKRFSLEKVMADWRSVSIHNVYNRSFSIDVAGFTTRPPIVPGLEYDINSFKNYLEKLIQMKADRLILKWERSKLAGPLGSISITKKSGKKINLELFNFYKGIEGRYAISSESDDLFELSKDETLPFFSGHQIFWNKVALPFKYRNMPRLPFKLTLGSDTYAMIAHFRGEQKFQILDNDKLDPKQKIFRTLFTFLSATADMASVLNHTADENELIKKSFLTLEINGDYYHFSEIGSDLLIINSSKSFKVRFTGASGKLPRNAAELFYAKE